MCPLKNLLFVDKPGFTNAGLTGSLDHDGNTRIIKWPGIKDKIVNFLIDKFSGFAHRTDLEYLFHDPVAVFKLIVDKRHPSPRNWRSLLILPVISPELPHAGPLRRNKGTFRHGIQTS